MRGQRVTEGVISYRESQPIALRRWHLSWDLSRMREKPGGSATWKGLYRLVSLVNFALSEHQQAFVTSRSQTIPVAFKMAGSISSSNPVYLLLRFKKKKICPITPSSWWILVTTKHTGNIDGSWVIILINVNFNVRRCKWFSLKTTRFSISANH